MKYGPNNNTVMLVRCFLKTEVINVSVIKMVFVFFFCFSSFILCNMSEAILVMCQKGIEQALREEQHRAFKMKGKTQNIPIAYLFCNCGNNAKEKLLRSLIVSSTLSFKMFMCHFFNENPNEQHEKIEVRSFSYNI